MTWKLQYLRIFMKNNDLNKETCRSDSVLPRLSKVFGRIMYIQIGSFMEDSYQNWLQDSEKIIAPNTV